MNKMNNEMICKETGKEMLAVKAEDLEGLYEDMACLYGMVGTLISQWNREEELRERHRSYLDVRKEMKRMCEEYSLGLEKITMRNEYFIHTCKLECQSYEDGKEPEQEMMSKEVNDMPEDIREEKSGKEQENFEVLFHKMERVLEGLFSDFLVMAEYVYKQHSILQRGYKEGKIDSRMMAVSNGIRKEVDMLFEKLEVYCSSNIFPTK